MTIVNGTTYQNDTTHEMIEILEHIRLSGRRFRFHWGDTKTGVDWGDHYDVTGTLGRSMGSMKVPILLHNRTSSGGGAILDHCIVRIRHANKKDGGDIYRHPNYHTKEPVKISPFKTFTIVEKTESIL